MWFLDQLELQASQDHIACLKAETPALLTLPLGRVQVHGEWLRTLSAARLTLPAQNWGQGRKGKWKEPSVLCIPAGL